MTLNKRIISLAILFAFLVASIAIGTFAWFTKSVELGGAEIGTGEIGLTCGSFVYDNGALQMVKENIGNENAGEEIPEGGTPVEETFSGNDATNSSVSITGNKAFKDITKTPLTFYLIVKKNEDSIDFTYAISAFLEGLDPEYDAASGEFKEFDAKNIGGFWYNIKTLSLDFKSSSYDEAKDALKAYIDANETVDVQEDEKKSLTKISEDTQKRTFADGTDCHFYALTLGAYEHATSTSNYFNQRIGIRANIMATQEEQRGNQTHVVGDIGTLRKVMAGYQPGDTIQLAGSLNVDGDLVFGAPLTLNMGGHTLTVTGNVRFEYDLGYDTIIDTTGGGRLIVRSAGSGVGNAGGDLSIICPNSLVRLNGTNSADRTRGDIYVQGSFSVRAAYDKGAIFNGCNIYETSAEGGIPAKAEDVKYKTIYVYDSTWVQIANNTTVGDIRVADANVTFFRLLNNGTVNHVYADKVSIIVDEDLISPQIYIYNNGIINGTNNVHITLPPLAEKWEEIKDADGNITEIKGNTRIVQGFKSNPLDVEGSQSFTKEHIERASVGDLVEKVDDKSDEIIVNYRDAGNEGPTTLQGILEEFFEKTENGYVDAADGYAIVKKLTVRTGYGKQITADDYACIRNFKNLEYIDLTAAETCDGDLTDIPVGTDETFSGHVYYIPAGAFDGLTKLETILLPSDTQVIRYALMGNTVFAGNIKYPTIVLPDSVVAIEMDRQTNKHALHHFYIVDMPTISTTVQVYVGGPNNGGDEHRIIVPTNKLADYRTEYGSLEEKIHWIPTSQFDDSGKYLVHFDDGKYTVTAVLGDVTNVQFTGLTLGGTDITVTGIFDYVFYNRKNIAEANLSDIETIGASAFEKAAVGRFTGLDNVASVGKRAFYDMKWNNAADFDLLANIGEEAFAYEAKTAIPSISMPSATVIGDKAFYNVKIGADGSISIGAETTTTSIGASAFENLDAAGKTVTFNGAISEIGNNAFKGAKTGALTFAGDVGTIGNNAFTKATGTSLGAITFGGNIELIKGGTSTTGGLYNVKGTSLTIEGAIKDAENYAIYSLDFTGGAISVGDITVGNYNYCYVKCATLTVNGSITAGTDCFSYITEADSLTFHGTIKEAGDRSFCHCTVNDSVTFNGELLAVAKRSFDSLNVNRGDDLNSYVTFNNDVNIDYDSLKDVTTDRLTFKKNAKLGQWAFRSSTITELRFEGTLNTISKFGASGTIGTLYVYKLDDFTNVEAFYDPSNGWAPIHNIQIDHVGTLGAGPATLPNIADWTFESVETIDTSFNQRKEYGQLVIKSNVGTIKTKAFQGVTVNGDLNFNNVTTIGDYAFAGATINGYVTFKGTVGSIGSNAFGAEPMANDPSNVETATSLHGLTFEGSVTKILQKAFYKLKITGNTKEIHFKDNVTAIGSNAFQSAEVKTIVFEKGLSEIGDYAFANITGGVTIKILGNIKSFGSNMLEGTEASLVLLGVTETVSDAPNTPTTYTMVEGSSIEKIGANAFKNCNITEMYITKVDTIGTNSFSGSKIGEVTFLGDVTTIEDSAFEGAADIGTLLFEGSLGTVGQYVFAGGTGENERSNIDQLAFNKKVTTIGQYTFTNCTIKNVAFSGGIGTIKTGAFENAIFGEQDATQANNGEFVVGAGIEEIQEDAFKGAIFYIDTVNFSENLTDAIGDRAFAGSQFKGSLTFGSVGTIGISAFESARIDGALTFTGNVSTIKSLAFNDVHAEKILFNGTVGDITNDEQYNANNESHKLITGLDGTPIISGAFNKVVADEIYFKYGAASIGNYAFASLQVHEVTFGDLSEGSGVSINDLGVMTSIGDGAFERSKITKTELGAYSGNLTFNQQINTIGSGIFAKNITIDGKVYFRYVDAFGANTFTRNYVNIGVFQIDKLGSASGHSFSYLKAQTAIFNSVAGNSSGAFQNCMGGINVGTLTLNLEDTCDDIGWYLLNGANVNEATITLASPSTSTDSSGFTGRFGSLTFKSAPGTNGGFSSTSTDENPFAGTYGTLRFECPVTKAAGFAKATINNELYFADLTNIDKEAFKGAKINKLTLPATVASIGESAFENATFTTSFVWTAAEDNRQTNVDENVFKGAVFGFVATKEGEVDSLLNVVFPVQLKILKPGFIANATAESFTFKGVTQLSAAADEVKDGDGNVTTPAVLSAIHGTNAKNIKFEALEEIAAEGALSGSNVKELDLSILATISADRVFQGMTGIETIELPALTKIESNEMFKGLTSLKEINLPLVTRISGSNTFEGCTSLSTIYLPKLTTIGSSTFVGVNGITSITSDANAMVTEGVLNLPALTTMGGSNFQSSTVLTRVTLNELTTMGGGNFSGCTILESVSMPKLTSMGESEFTNCLKLKEINLPEVTQLPAYVFQGCTSIPYLGTDPSGNGNDIMPNLTSLGSLTFSDCKSITSIKLKNLTNGGNSAFDGCTSLETVDLPKVTTAGGNTFSGCTSLKDVNLPALEGLGANMFSGTAIESLYLPSVTECNISMTLANCQYLKTVNMPNIVSITCPEMFKNCTSLTEVYMPEVKMFTATTFSGCTSLQIVELGAIGTIQSGSFSAPAGNCVVIIRGNATTNIDGIDEYTNKVIFIGDNGNTFASDAANGRLVQLGEGWRTDNIGYYSDANGLRYAYTTSGTPAVPYNIQLLYCFADTIASADLTADFTAVEGKVVGGKVTSIGASCYFNTAITGETLNLGAGITSIGAHAFNNAYNGFTKFATGNVTEIGAHAFEKCTLADLSLGVALTKLGKTAFGTTANVRIAQQAANEFNLVLDETDKTEGSTMFGAEAKLYVNGVVLQELIDDGQTYFGAIALENNENINTDSMHTVEGFDLYYQVTESNTVTITGAIYTGNGTNTHLVIPNTIDSNNVTQISERAFSGVKDIITELTLPMYLAAFNPTDKAASGLVFYKDDALTALTKYHVAEGCVNYYADANGVLYDASKTTLILCPINVAVGENGVLGIPNTVTKFYVYAFYGNENVMDTNNE